MSKKIIIVGAGPGGLTAGMILANNGFDVEIFEKESKVGGRNSFIHSDGYTFDIGPTFLMMNFILDEIFKMVGKDINDYLDQIKLEPMYRLKFDDLEISMSSDKEKMINTIKNIFPGEETGYIKFLKKEEKKFKKMLPCLQTPYSSIFSMFSKNMIKAIPFLDLGKSIFQNLGEYFLSEKLKLSFTFQSKYLGMSAWECPAAFSIIPFVEHNFGIFHVKGGLNKISEAMAKIIKENNGKIHLNSNVENIIIENKQVKGIKLTTNKKVFADEVIINADFAYAMSELTENKVKKYTKEKVKKLKYSCSTFMIYLGLDKIYDIPHHNIFFAEKYKENIDNIFKNGKISQDMSFYIQNASITDSTLAPNGHSTIYILVPISNNSFNINWDEEKNRYAEQILDKIEEKTELKHIRKHIKFQKIITPLDWEKNYNVYNGATFNLSHNIFQMLYFRPHNKLEGVKNCYIVGGGTHPGSGLPTIYESGKISATMILEKHKK